MTGPDSEGLQGAADDDGWRAPMAGWYDISTDPPIYVGTGQSPVVPSVGAVPVEVPEEAVDAVMQELEPALAAVGVTLTPAVFQGRSYVGRKLIERVAPLIAARVRAEAVAAVLAEQSKFVETVLHHEGFGQYPVRGLSWSNAQSAARIAAGCAVPAIDCDPAGSDSGVADSGRMQGAARTSVPVANHRSAGRVAPAAGSAVPVATPQQRTAHDAMIAAQALMGVIGEIDDLDIAEMVANRAVQFEQEARALSVATPTEPELPSQAIHAMTRRDQPRNHHLENVRYCERCGAQIEGPNAWGHDDHCPKREPSPAEQDGQR